MADIRQSAAFKEDFRILPVQDPISVGGRWARTDAALVFGLRVRSPDLVLSPSSPTLGSSYFTPESWDGDDAECWAFCSGGNSSGIAWSIGLVSSPGGSGAVDGYEFYVGATTGGPFSRFYKVTNGNYVQVSGVGSLPNSYNDRHWQLIRRNGSAVEGWVSVDTGPAGSPTNWTMVDSITDTTYQTGLFADLTLVDNSGSFIHGYEVFGGGPSTEHRQQIYRVLRGHRPASVPA